MRAKWAIGLAILLTEAGLRSQRCFTVGRRLAYKQSAVGIANDRLVTAGLTSAHFPLSNRCQKSHEGEP